MAHNEKNDRGRKFEDLLIYAKRISYSKKIANDFAWAKASADTLDMLKVSRDEFSRRKENYSLWNGKGTDSVQLDTFGAYDTLHDEGFESAHSKVQHHDVISQIGHAMHGEQIARNLDVHVVDSSKFSQSERARAREELVSNYLQEKFIKPAVEQATMMLMQQQGIEDPYSMAPEQQQELQGQAEQMAAEMTPQDIQKYMKKNFRSTREKQANKLISLLIKEHKVKYYTDYNFQNAIIDGREIYRVGVRNERPFLEIINPLNFRFSTSSDSLFIEDGEWAIYERYITLADVYNKYSDSLTRSQLKRLDVIAGIGTNNMGYIEDIKNARIIGSPDFDAYKKAISGVNPRTKEGQRKLVDINQRYSGVSGNLALIRESHISWKAQRRLKHIKRIDEEGEVSYFYVDESYKFNPYKGDIEQKDVWVNEVWEVTKLGDGDDAVYVNIGPTPFQYRSLQNPRNVKLPYIGAEYFTLMGNSENTSPLEKGKPWQYDINITMAKIREIESMDIGNVLLTTLAAKPDNWGWGKFFQIIRHTKMVPLDLNKEGVNAFDAQFFKSVDLSTAQDLASKVTYLEWLINRAATAMSFNAARLGQTQQYSTATNNQQNLARSLSQTASVYQTHDEIVKNVLEAMLHAARVAYKKNPVYLANILDDGEIAELELDPELLWSSELGVFVSNSGDEIDNLNMVKQNLMHFIQNGLGLPDSIRVLWSKSGSELFGIASEIEEKQQAQQAAQQQAMQEMQMQQIEMDKAMEELRGNIKAMLQEKDLAAKIEMAAINAQTIRNSVDVNNNNENDYLERAVITDQINKEKFDTEMVFEREKFKKEMEIKEKELEIKEKMLKSKPKK